MKPVYQTILSLLVGIVVWLIIVGLFLALLRDPGNPPLKGFLPFVLFGLPVAFFSAAFSTGFIMPGHRRFLIVLLVVLIGICICLCILVAVFDPGDGVVLVAVFGSLCITGVLFGYGFRHLLIPRLGNRSLNE